MAMDMDAIFKVIGEFGPYQRRVYFLLCLPFIFVATSNLAYVFIGATPEHYRCIVPACDTNLTDLQYNRTFLEFTIPYNKTSGFSKCQRYKHIDEEEGCIPSAFMENTTEDCPEGKVFDTTVYATTIVTEFNLTCHDAWEANMAQTIYFSGVLIGAFVFGFIADRIGRMLTILIGLVCMVVSGVITALVTSLRVFNVMRFLNAMMATAVFQTSFVLGMECVGANYRVMCGIIGEYFFALGEVLLGLVALWIRDWRMIQLVISAPAACFIFYKWFIPESPRWLLVQGKTEKAYTVLQKIAKGNGKDLPLHLMRESEEENSGEEDGTAGEKMKNKPTILDIFKTPLLCVRMFSMFFIWIVTTLVYYGISLNASSLSSSDTSYGPYLNFILVALVEVPGYTLAWLGMCKWGRRGSLASSLILAGIFCAGSGFAEETGKVSVLIPALLGKCCITCSFGIIYVFTSEIFPTNVRSTVVGLSSTAARFGAMLAPFSSDLAEIYTPLPMIVFGGLSFVAGLLNVVMPETLNTQLPDTVLDALNLGKKAEHATTGQESGTLAEAQALLQDTNDDDDDVINGQIVFGNDVETDDDEQPLV